MAKTQVYLSFIIILYLLSEGNFMMVESAGEWCVAKPSTTHEMLQANMNYACSKIDCGIIHNGGCCASEHLISRASVAMNLYYQAQGRRFSGCHFAGSGILAVTDPSFGCCVYQFRH